MAWVSSSAFFWSLVDPAASSAASARSSAGSSAASHSASIPSAVTPSSVPVRVWMSGASPASTASTQAVIFSRSASSVARKPSKA